MKNVIRKIWLHKFQRVLFYQKKKAKIDKKTRDKIYEDEKRARTYVPTWTETYPWVKFVEGKMYCNYVIDFNKSCIH